MLRQHVHQVEELKGLIEELDGDRVRSEEERQRLRDEYEMKLGRMEHQLSVARQQLKEQDMAKVLKRIQGRRGFGCLGDDIEAACCADREG